MDVFALQTVADSGGRLQEIARTFGVDWTHLLAQTISFAIVCAVLYRFAYGPVLAMLEARRQQIALGLANAEKIQAELALTETRRQEVLAAADAQARTLIEEARVAAARVRELDTQKAAQAAEQILVKAREAAVQDHARMLAELKREVGRLVVQTTAAVTGRILTPEDHRRLADETARRLASS
jgi:F-type H+-transporting ATPase subunit b